MSEIPTTEIPTIQIWNTFRASVGGELNPIENPFVVDILQSRPVPALLEAEVDAEWQKNVQKNPKAKDAQILYLESSVDTGVSGDKTPWVLAHASVRGFKYTQTFNRMKEFHGRTEELSAYRLLSFSTHSHLVSKDGKILFGTKKNQFNQISGFGGFPNVAEDADGSFLDVYRTVKNRLKPEIGDLVQAIRNITAVGVVYVDTPALRGTDSDYVVELDETAENVQKKFEASYQFERKLHIVEFEPSKIKDFIQDVHRKGGVMSNYAMGCMFAEVEAFFGKPEADKVLETIRSIGVSAEAANKTTYFSKP